MRLALLLSIVFVCFQTDRMRTHADLLHPISSVSEKISGKTPLSILEEKIKLFDVFEKIITRFSKLITDMNTDVSQFQILNSNFHDILITTEQSNRGFIAQIKNLGDTKNIVENLMKTVESLNLNQTFGKISEFGRVLNLEVIREFVNQANNATRTLNDLQIQRISTLLSNSVSKLNFISGIDTSIVSNVIEKTKQLQNVVLRDFSEFEKMSSHIAPFVNKSGFMFDQLNFLNEGAGKIIHRLETFNKLNFSKLIDLSEKTIKLFDRLNLYQMLVNVDEHLVEKTIQLFHKLDVDKIVDSAEKIMHNIEGIDIVMLVNKTIDSSIKLTTELPKHLDTLSDIPDTIFSFLDDSMFWKFMTNPFYRIAIAILLVSLVVCIFMNTLILVWLMSIYVWKK